MVQRNRVERGKIVRRANSKAQRGQSSIKHTYLCSSLYTMGLRGSKTYQLKDLRHDADLSGSPLKAKEDLVRNTAWRNIRNKIESFNKGENKALRDWYDDVLDDDWRKLLEDWIVAEHFKNIDPEIWVVPKDSNPFQFRLGIEISRDLIVNKMIDVYKEWQKGDYKKKGHDDEIQRSDDGMNYWLQRKKFFAAGRDAALALRAR